MEIFFKTVRVVGEGGGTDERRLAELVIVGAGWCVYECSMSYSLLLFEYVCIKG